MNRMKDVVFYLSSQMSSQLFGTLEGLSRQLGRANYSYSLAMRKFCRAFEAENISFAELPAPSILRGPPAASAADHRNPVHLAFYPPDELRLLKGCTNVLVFAWEFSRMRTDEIVISSHAFASHARMLALVDAVWTPSHYAAEVIRQVTSKPVHVIPAPLAVFPKIAASRIGGRLARQKKQIKILTRLHAVTLAIFPRYQPLASGLAYSEQFSIGTALSQRLQTSPGLTVFLSILNPHDARKGLLPAIEAFCRVSQLTPNALWIIKTASHDDTPESINTRLFTHQVARESDLAGQFFSDNIWICNDALSEDEMTSLYALADYYICTSHAEGQNLPLQEAMACGVVPVSVAHTAMADYIDEDDAIVIPSRKVMLPPDVANKYGLFGAEWFSSTMLDVHHALLYALLMPRSEYHRLSQNAFERISKAFSPQTILNAIRSAV